MTEEELHRNGVSRLAIALHEVVDRRGNRDLRQWGGPSRGTVNEILSGTWKTSPQARGTFEKLDKAGPWRPGTAWGIYRNHPSVVTNLVDGIPQIVSDTPKDVLDNAALSDVPGKVPTIAKAGGRGEELLSTEREDIAEALARVGGQLAALAGELVALAERVADPPPTP